MNEFMGLIRGMYEAKQDGFLPGGCALGQCNQAGLGGISELWKAFCAHAHKTAAVCLACTHRATAHSCLSQRGDF
jgi:homogentisate 1,2-dioxygenase